MAAYEFNDHISAQLNVLNVFDKTYYTKAYAAHYAALGTGRAALLSLRVKYRIASIIRNESYRGGFFIAGPPR